MTERIVVLGGNFAGVTAALETRRRAGRDVDIVVISPAQQFLYVPSLIWVPFGLRQVNDIRFDIEPVLRKRDIRFIHDKAVRVLPEENRVLTDHSGDIDYDYVVCATGVKLDFSILDHLEPKEGYVQCIATPPLAEQAYRAFEDLVAEPGPVVVGATQGASCMGAAYEYLFNLEKQLRRRGVRKQVDITWITPEPYLGHFGIGGITGGEKMLKGLMKMYNIQWHVSAVIAEIQRDKMILADGSELPYRMSMLMPPFLGADVMFNSRELVGHKGFVVCNDGYQHVDYKNVFSAGLAVQVVSPFPDTAAPFGIPKTGFPSDVQGKIVAKNITHMINGSSELETMAFGKIPAVCIMDAGRKEVWILASSLFKPRKFEIMIPNIFYNAGKLILERYMLLKNRMGWAFLP